MRDSVVGHRHRPPRDNRSHAASEGRDRGSDLAVTAGELNAGAGVGFATTALCDTNRIPWHEIEFHSNESREQ